jgi:hypothetical protein
MASPFGDISRFAPAQWTRGTATVLAAALTALGLKIWMGLTTAGAGDVYYFKVWADMVRRYGVYGIYPVIDPGGAAADHLPYNHPPLTGLMLRALEFLNQHGLPWPLLIRLPADLADFMVALVVYDCLRRRQPRWKAVTAGVLTAFSPILFVISGFHGNTDPICAGLALLSGYLLADRKRPLAAGMVLAAAVSVKIPSVVAVLPLMVAAGMMGRRTLLRFALGAAGVIAVLWGPLLWCLDSFAQDVLFYNGSFSHDWGVLGVVHMLRMPDWFSQLVLGPGRFVSLLLATGLGIWLVVRNRAEAAAAAALSMAAFLALSPSFGPQYLPWAGTGALLVDGLFGTIFTVVGGAYVVWLYNTWCGGLPWDKANIMGMTGQQLGVGTGVWAALCMLVVQGLRVRLRGSGPAAGPGAGRRVGLGGQRSVPSTVRAQRAAAER